MLNRNVIYLERILKILLSPDKCSEMLTKIWNILPHFRPGRLYEKDSEYEIYHLTSAFKRRVTRKRFDNFIQPYDLSALRSTGFTGGFIYMFFVVLDFFINQEAFTQIVIIRLLIVTPLSLVTLFLTYFKPFNENNKALQWLGVTILIIGQLGHFVMGMLPGVHEFYILASTIVLLIVGNNLMPTRFWLAFYANLVYLLFFQITLFVHLDTDYTTIFYQNFILVSAMFVSLHACYLRESNKCLLFVEFDIADKRKKELEKVNKNQEELLSSLDYKNKELEQFAFVISHDLKSPLRVISGLSSLIQRKEYEKISPQSREDFDMIQDQVLQMGAMIEGVLEYSRIGRKDDDDEAIDLIPILESIALTTGKQDNVSIDFPKNIPLLKGSAIRFKQVFQNLISNAIKYKDKPHCEVLIQAEMKDDFVQFSLQDNGPGIRPEYAERIFRLFQTLQSKEKNSTGVGLAIVKKIIDFYEGKIHLDANFEEGARFHFTLPIYHDNLISTEINPEIHVPLHANE